MQLPTFYLASFTFLVSLLVHLLAITGWIVFPPIILFPLFLCAFIVIFFANRYRTKINRQLNPTPLKWNGGISAMKRLFFTGSPKLIQRLAVISFYYTFVNFFTLFFLGDIPVEQADGSFVGRDNELPMSVVEVARYNNNIVRIMTSLLLAFLAMSIAMMFPRKLAHLVGGSTS